MDTRFVDRLRRTLNLEVARRLLVRYFMGKIGEDISPSEGFDRLIYPPSIQDLPFAIPELFGKVEVEPHMRTVNQFDDTAEIGWNLFVLGTHRKYLGETYHTNLRLLASQIQQGQIMQETQEEQSSAGRQATPKEVIAFVMQILGSHGEGIINLERPASALPMQDLARYGYPGATTAGQFYRRTSQAYRL